MQTISLNIYKKTVVPVLCAKQGDVGRKFQATITDGSKEYKIPDGAIFSVWYSGASGEGNYTHIGDSSAFSIDGNTITVELITQMLVNAGEGQLCLVMNSADGTQLATWNIPYVVEPIPGMESAVAEQYYTAFSELKHLPFVAVAEPDQTIVVKEVDEDGKPTLWEAVTLVGEPGKGVDAAVFNGNDPETAPGENAAVVGATYEYLDGVRIQMPKASGKASTVSGMGCQATANAADASGILTKATAPCASAKGNNTIACGYGSSAEGGSTIAAGTYQHAEGTFNEPDYEGKYAHIVGGGTKVQRKNIHTLDWEGNAWFSGKVLAAVLNLCGDECSTGVKGFYWTDIRKDVPEEGMWGIFLSAANGDFGTEQEFNIADFWEPGDVISIHHNQKLYNSFSIAVVSEDAIYINGDMPFDKIVSQSDHFTDNAVYVLDKPGAGLVDFGRYANAAGLMSKALNYCATAFGSNVNVFGQYGFGAGRDHEVGHAGAAFGRGNAVLGEQAFGAGAFNTVLGNLAAVFGRDNMVNDDARAAFVAGLLNEVSAEAAVAFGNDNQVSGVNAFAAGKDNFVGGENAIALGNSNTLTEKANNAVAVGTSNTVQAKECFAEGLNNIAGGDDGTGAAAHAEGYGTKAKAQAAHSEGLNTEATAKNAHAEGNGSKATAESAHAEGSLTVATASYAHSEGRKSQATGTASHAQNGGCVASGEYSDAGGRFTEAKGKDQFVRGRYNVLDETSLIIVGNGTATKRSNAHTLDENGNAWFAGSVEGMALILKSPNGARFQIAVDDNGNLTASAI